MDFEKMPPRWDAEGTEPTNDLKTKGFTAGYKPPAAYFNWLFNKITACLTELQTKLSSTFNEITNFKKIRRINTYISYEDIGLTAGNETIEEIAEKLPSNSELLISVGEANAAIFPQTYGVLHVLKKDSSRVVFKFYSKSTAYEYLGIYDVNIAPRWSGWVYLLGENDVVDNLTSSATKVPLSAKQGKVLHDNYTAHVTSTTNPHAVTKAQVGLGNVPNVSTNDQTPTYSDTNTLATLSSGEKLNVALQKIKCAITNLINHINTHKLATYIDLADTGQTYGSETIEGIATGLPNNSELLITIGAGNSAIYPHTYGVLHVLKKDATRVTFKFYSKSTGYIYTGTYDSSQSEPWSGWVYLLGQKDVVDNLVSTATNLPLSAKQGSVLSGKIGELVQKFSTAADTKKVHFFVNNANKTFNIDQYISDTEAYRFEISGTAKVMRCYFMKNGQGTLIYESNSLRKYMQQYCAPTELTKTVEITIPDGQLLQSYPAIVATLNSYSSFFPDLCIVAAVKVSDTTIRIHFNKEFTGATMISLSYSIQS